MDQSTDSVYFNKSEINEQVNNNKYGNLFYGNDKNLQDSQFFILKEKIKYLEEENAFLKNRKPEVIHTLK